MIGIIGRKRGMTRVFTEDGQAIPVTVVEVEFNRVTQRKTQAKDGYDAIQVTYGYRHANRVNKPTAGHLAKVGLEAGCGFCEFRFDESKIQVGNEVTLDIFKVGQKVDVIGTTKGKGFSGAIKRHHFSMQDATHGNSLSHRSAGSIGQNQSPGRVFKGKKMAGQMGNVRCSVQNLDIVRMDTERKLLFIKGAVPGMSNGNVIIQPAVKGLRAKD